MANTWRVNRASGLPQTYPGLVMQIGPLKSHFIRDTGISSVTFASFLSALSILNTVTPLVSGAWLPRLGVGRTAVLATTLVCLGQAVVLLGQCTTNYRFLPTMVGLAMFSSCLAPLMVVQETIVLNNVGSQYAGVAMGKSAGRGRKQLKRNQLVD
jgi:hypothetical protein